MKIKEVSKVTLEWITLIAGIIFCFYMFMLSENDTKLLFVVGGIVAIIFTAYSLITYKTKVKKANEEIIPVTEELLNQYFAEDIEKIKKGRSRNIYKHCQTLQEILAYYQPDPKYFGLKGKLIIPPIENIQNKILKQLINLYGKEKIKGPVIIISNDEEIKQISIHYDEYLFNITADKINVVKAENPDIILEKRDVLKSLSV